MNVIYKIKALLRLKIYLAILGLLLISTVVSQSFNIGHTSIVFHDDIRNRDINTEIYYPADNSGENEPVSIGNFPVLVFGHGFLWDGILIKTFGLKLFQTDMFFVFLLQK